MSYILYPILALMPSLIWLLFYLRKDAHPESNRMILLVFIAGMLAALPAVAAEIGFQKIFSLLPSPQIAALLYFLIGIAFTEEIFKYLAAQQTAFKSKELDEAPDVMLYMIIAALGFAAFENLLYLWPGRYALPYAASDSILLALQRFVGATFLHALASGAFGYFIALSFLHKKRRRFLFFAGLALTSLLHGLFNYSIIEIEGVLKPGIPLVILIGLAIFVSWAFQKTKKMPSVCIIAKLTQNKTQN